MTEFYDQSYQMTKCCLFMKSYKRFIKHIVQMKVLTKFDLIPSLQKRFKKVEVKDEDEFCCLQFFYSFQSFLMYSCLLQQLCEIHRQALSYFTNKMKAVMKKTFTIHINNTCQNWLGCSNSSFWCDLHLTVDFLQNSFNCCFVYLSL